ncbi:uncharacterized protein LOC100888544 [Strongylocentrotus purpuratus]|uniref:Uncharacterized protein n=1 Tax=Strongylocentrotus purpuratus TaxID=7668 RepID=A0A7M7GJD2_STRPU|nr:uncharacterized protein LOC100888544 [Strongylocentrotus purpuratus]
MQSSTTTAGRLSTKMIGDKPLLVPDRHTTDVGMEDKANENVTEINANYVTSEVVSRGLGNTGIQEHKMAKKNSLFVDRSHNVRELEAECHGDDRDVDIMGRERTSKDVAQTKSQTKNLRSEKGAKDDDGSRSQSRRRRGRNEDRNTVGSNQEPAPTRHRWKRVRKFFGKHFGRALNLIGMGALVSPPGPGTYISVQTRSCSENQNVSASYGMFLF